MFIFSFFNSKIFVQQKGALIKIYILNFFALKHYEIVYSTLITMNTFIIIRLLVINSLTSTFVQIHHLIDTSYRTSKQNDCLDPS